MRSNTINLIVAGIRLTGVLLCVLLLSSCSWKSGREVGRMMDYSVNSVYTKRSNLKEKLLNLAIDDKEIILALMRC